MKTGISTWIRNTAFLFGMAFLLFPTSIKALTPKIELKITATPSKIEHGESVTLDVEIRNNEDADIAIRKVPLPYQIFAVETGKKSGLKSDIEKEIVPCVVSETCEAIRIEPGKMDHLQFKVDPFNDLGLGSAGPHEIRVSIKIVIDYPGRIFPPEVWVEGSATVEIAGDLKDPVMDCPTSNESLSLEADGKPDRGPQERISIRVRITNRTNAPLTVPRQVGCPSPVEWLKLYPTGYTGKVEDLRDIYGTGVMDACPIAREKDFLTLDPDDDLEFRVTMDPLIFGPVPPGSYSAVVVLQNELDLVTGMDDKPRKLDNPWKGCLRSHALSIRIDSE